MFFKRLFDIMFSLLLLCMLSPIIVLIIILIKINTKGPVFHVSKRIGKNNKQFNMLKFCTMLNNTPNIASHLLKEPVNYITYIGSKLRKSSLDEIPQLVNILVGEMSFVGPRPALYNQFDLITLRTIEGIHLIKPGLTGWAQVNGRDKLDILNKIKYDKEYLNQKSMYFDLFILIKTIYIIFNKDDIIH